MRTLREWMWRLSAAVMRRRSDADMEEELRSHLQFEAEAQARAGCADAGREARFRAGHVPVVLDQMRDQRGAGWLTGLPSEIRHAARALRSNPTFTLTSLAAIASAAALNTLIFTILYGVLLKPLPYPEPERLVRVYDASDQLPKWPVSLGMYQEYARSSSAFASIGLYTASDVPLSHGDRSERLRGLRVTHDFLPTLGVPLLIGRNFDRSEMTQTARVAIISHSLWTSRFGSDRSIVGRSLRINREPWTVIGVLPAGFQHVGGAYASPGQGDSVQIWTPLPLDVTDEHRWAWHYTNAVARLLPGVSLAQASYDTSRIAEYIARRHANFRRSFKAAAIRPLRDEVVGAARTTLVLIAVAAGIVLLIACSNIAGLAVARGLARQEETAVRKALGAGRWRLIRVGMAESFVLGVCGAIAGLALTLALLPALRAMIPQEFPRLHEVGISPVAVAYGIAVALITSVVAGLVPAFRQAGRDVREAVRQMHGARFRAALVSGQIAFAIVLSVSAALLLRSSERLDRRDHGFDADRTFTFNVSLPPTAYKTSAEAVRFYDALSLRLRQLPGVVSAGVATNLPWSGYDENVNFQTTARPDLPSTEGMTRFQSASPGYFAALRLRLLHGRLIDGRDVAGRPLAVVINERFAQMYLNGRDPLGLEIDVFGAKRRIIGVVADIRDWPADANAAPAVWMPMAQQSFPGAEVVVRTAGDPELMRAGFERALRDVDPEMPMGDPRLMSDIASSAWGERRFALWLFEVFAVVAVALATIGTYGLLAYTAQRRRREIGIRVALGATPAGVAWFIAREGARLASFGALAGLLLSPLTGRALAALLYGVSPTDAPAIGAGVALLMCSAAVATIGPAYAAWRAEPMRVLREQ